MNYLDIGPVPCEEACVQVGENDLLARQECRRFIELIKKHFGEPPEGAELIVRRHTHEFGPYFEVAVQFDDSASDYAYLVEANSPMTWDSEPCCSRCKKNVVTPFALEGKPVCKECKP